MKLGSGHNIIIWNDMVVQNDIFFNCECYGNGTINIMWLYDTGTGINIQIMHHKSGPKFEIIYLVLVRRRSMLFYNCFGDDIVVGVYYPFIAAICESFRGFALLRRRLFWSAGFSPHNQYVVCKPFPCGGGTKQQHNHTYGLKNRTWNYCSFQPRLTL